MRLLHAFSGGIDSTSVLLQLAEMGHQITTLHVDLRGPKSTRWQAERIAVHNILNWLGKRGTPLVHIDCGVTQLSGKWFDIEVVALHMGNHLRAEPAFVGTSDSSSGYDMSRTSSGMERRVANRKAITEMLAGRPLEWIAPNVSKSREQVVAELPPEVLRMTNFCRTPKVWFGGYSACGTCLTCKSTRLRRALGAGLGSSGAERQRGELHKAGS
jgi:hypothetical protein